MWYSKRDLQYEQDHVNELLAGLQDDMIRCRVRNVLTWYVRGAHLHRGRHFAATIAATLCNTVIPIIILTQEVTPTDILIASLSAISGFLLILAAHYKWHDNWLRNRYNSEMVKTETFKFINRIEPYHDDRANAIFINVLEENVSRERNNWMNMRNRQNDNNPVNPNQPA